MTNRELAHQLNISPASLSLILNHKPGVSSATRERIVQQLGQLGYSNLIKPYPNPPCQNDNICFVIYRRHGLILDQHPFFLLMTESIENHARKHGYHILLTTVDRKNPIDEQIDNLNQMNAKGFIIFATEMLDDDIACFKKLKQPYISMDNDFTNQNINAVSINNAMGAYQAVNYLYQMGHRHIGYLQSQVHISSFGEREHCYKDAMECLGIQLHPEYHYKVRYTEEGSYQDFKIYLQTSPSLPTAFVADDDTMAIGVMRALSEKGIRVPEDISIIGFNDRPACQISAPRLTTINVPRHSFGTEAVDCLLSLVERHKGSVIGRSIKIRIGTQLVQRESVKKLNVGAETD